MAFPLFTQQMLKTLGYNWSNTLFALVALALVPVPMVCLYFILLSRLCVDNILCFRYCSFTDRRYARGVNSHRKSYRNILFLSRMLQR